MVGLAPSASEDRCLKRDDVGTIVQDDHDAQPYKVVNQATNETGWYDDRALVRVDAPDMLGRAEQGTVTTVSTLRQDTKDNWRKLQTADALIRFKDASVKYAVTAHDLAAHDTAPSKYILKLERFDLREARANPEALQRKHHSPPKMRGAVPGTVTMRGPRGEVSPEPSGASPRSPRRERRARQPPQLPQPPQPRGE